jgi:hypothetical protein
LNHLYSLYDALVSISVPIDKARAVVDAMERNMVTAMATKSDLQLLRQELVSEFRHDIAELRQEVALIRKDVEVLPTTMTVRLGSIVVLGLGVLFAALKLT